MSTHSVHNTMNRLQLNQIIRRMQLSNQKPQASPLKPHPSTCYVHVWSVQRWLHGVQALSWIWLCVEICFFLHRFVYRFVDDSRVHGYHELKEGVLVGMMHICVALVGYCKK